MPQERRHLASSCEITCTSSRFHPCAMSLYRCEQNDDAKVVLADAVQHVEQSVNVWLATADLENGEKARKLVLRRGTTFLHIFLTISYHYAALEHIPNFVRLWKETVNLETSPADARTLLSRAVELIPLSVELWLSLLRASKHQRTAKPCSTRHAKRCLLRMRFGSPPGASCTRRRHQKRSAPKSWIA